MLLEEATEAGLFGASPFFSPRALSMPFSGGEWAGLTRGVAGSCEIRGSIGTLSSRTGSLWLLHQPGTGLVLGGSLRHHPQTPTVQRGEEQTPMPPRLTSLETSTTRSSLLSPSLS